MREVESDGFITREEDLMKSKTVEWNEAPTVKEMQECPYPKCEDCDKYVLGLCTVPMVITKQIYHYFTDEMVRMDKDIAELKTLVYDEILGDGGDEAKLVSFKLSKELCKNPRVEIKE